jgi:hypothetical protein
LVVVYKNDVETRALPPALRTQEGFKFFRREPNGSVHEFYWRELRDSKAYFGVLLHIARLIASRMADDKKSVLLLGRFIEGRIEVLERLREELRKRGYVPIVFNFDKPETKDFTETVRLLAGQSRFIIADITNPKSAPLELQATVPEIMVPFQPLIQKGEKPFAMLQDLWMKHRVWVFEPIEYSSVDRLIEALDSQIIGPAETRFNELVLRKAERMTMRQI